MKFSALNINMSSPSTDPLGLRRPAQAGVKDRYPYPKKWLFYGFNSCSVKTIADKYIHLLIVTSNSDKLFIGANVDDLE